jgi:cyclopropane fatty-acyl-phospholipid synthase-like methyltransferase
MRRRLLPAVAALAFALAAPIGVPARQATPPKPAPRLDVIYVPTDEAVVAAMLKLAGVGRNDVVYDLGCGDGRIVIAAARDFGARGVGIDLDPVRIAEARAAAIKAGVADRVTFIEGDLFDPSLPLGEATVVTLFLLQRLNEQLRPRLQRELKPGARVVSHAWTMGDRWPADATVQAGDSVLYLWKIKPPGVARRR